MQAILSVLPQVTMDIIARNYSYVNIYLVKHINEQNIFDWNLFINQFTFQ